MTPTIAVVENDASVLDAIKMMLVAAGWIVRAYDTGEAFLSSLASNGPPQCLILDPHLPDMNGADIAHAFRKEGREIPIIALTARPGSPVTQEIIEAGARAILTKPVTAEEIVDHVLMAIDTPGTKQ